MREWPFGGVWLNVNYLRECVEERSNGAVGFMMEEEKSIGRESDLGENETTSDSNW